MKSRRPTHPRFQRASLMARPFGWSQGLYSSWALLSFLTAMARLVTRRKILTYVTQSSRNLFVNW